MKFIKSLLILVVLALLNSCNQPHSKQAELSAANILGNPDYMAFSYGGYRQNTRDSVPSVKDIKEDLRILAAMGVKIIRTYNSQQYAQAANLLSAIHELLDEDPEFEMYVMLGAWIDCEGAWTATPNHDKEDLLNNSVEIQAAVDMANAYPDIVKIIAVGNEAMVHWAASYYVGPSVILKWVNHLQKLKKSGKLPKDIWITSSDNFASWGGGDDSYHINDLTDLIKAVDYISLHTYPFHDTYYNSAFWNATDEEVDLSDIEKIDAAMLRAKEHAMSQFQSAADYIASLGIEKPIHIGETGWASIDATQYGTEGTRASDEYKMKLYYNHMRDWSNEAGLSCFYFEAFDEQWKDPISNEGSENHFGMINLRGEAKYVLWDLVDEGAFEGLKRGSVTITKTFDGDEAKMMEFVFSPPAK